MAHGILVLWPRIEHKAWAVKAWRQYPGRPPGSFPSDIVFALYFFIKHIPWAHVQISCSSFFKQGLCGKVPAWLNPTPPSLAGLTANSSLPFQCPVGTAPASPPQASHPKPPQIITSHPLNPLSFSCSFPACNWWPWFLLHWRNRNNQKTTIIGRYNRIYKTSWTGAHLFCWAIPSSFLEPRLSLV